MFRLVSLLTACLCLGWATGQVVDTPPEVSKAPEVSNHGVFDTPAFETLNRWLSKNPTLFDHVKRFSNNRIAGLEKKYGSTFQANPEVYRFRVPVPDGKISGTLELFHFNAGASTDINFKSFLEQTKWPDPPVESLRDLTPTYKECYGLWAYELGLGPFFVYVKPANAFSESQIRNLRLIDLVDKDELGLGKRMGEQFCSSRPFRPDGEEGYRMPAINEDGSIDPNHYRVLEWLHISGFDDMVYINLTSSNEASGIKLVARESERNTRHSASLKSEATTDALHVEITTYRVPAGEQVYRLLGSLAVPFQPFGIR